MFHVQVCSPSTHISTPFVDAYAAAFITSARGCAPYVLLCQLGFELRVSLANALFTSESISCLSFDQNATRSFGMSLVIHRFTARNTVTSTIFARRGCWTRTSTRSQNAPIVLHVETTSNVVWVGFAIASCVIDSRCSHPDGHAHVQHTHSDDYGSKSHVC